MRMIIIKSWFVKPRISANARLRAAVLELGEKVNTE